MALDNLQGNQSPLTTVGRPPGFGVLLLLGMLGFVINAVDFDVSFGVAFIFGSTVAMVTSLLGGAMAGGTVGLLGGAYTWLLWGHPWAAIIFALEGFCCGWLLHHPRLRQRMCLTTVSVVFWLCLGAPMVWVFYHGVMDLPAYSVRFIMFKQALNGIYNAVLAEFIVYLCVASPALPVHRWLRIKPIRWRTRDMTVAALVGISLFTSILMVYFGDRQYLAEQKSLYEQQHALAFAFAKERIEDRYQHVGDNPHGELSFDELNADFEDYGLVVEYPGGRWVSAGVPDTIAATGPALEMITSVVGDAPLMERWLNSVQVRRAVVSDGDIKLAVVNSMDKVIEAAWQHGSQSLTVAAMVVAFSLALGLFYTRYVTHALVRTASIVANAETLRRNDDVITSLTEYGGFEPREIYELRHVVAHALQAEYRAFQQLHATAEDWRNLVRDANAPIIILDKLGNVLDWNSAVAELTGYPREEALAKSIDTLLHDPSAAIDLPRLFAALRRGDDLSNLSLSFTNQAGRRVTLLYSVVLLSASEQTGERVVLVAQDMTEYLKREQQLLQVSKMSSLGEMATGMAHELNQPLNIIRLTLQNMKRLIGDQTPIADALLPKLSRIDEQVGRSASLIDHLRLYGRRNDVADLSEATFNPDESIKGALTLFVEQFKLANVVSRVELSNAVPQVRGDGMLFELAIINVLSNARDALILAAQEEGVSPLVEIQSRLDEGSSCYVLDIKDNAGGIAEPELAHIFEPFYTTKPPSQGSGLGLSVVDSIAVGMGGSVTAANREGGLVISFSLPLATSPLR